MKKHIGGMLISVLVGFTVVYLLLGRLAFDINIPSMKLELTVIFTVISILLMIISLIGYNRIKVYYGKIWLVINRMSSSCCNIDV